MSHDVLHIEGAILVGPEDTRPDVWVVDGRISYAAPGAGADVQTVRGWVLPPVSWTATATSGSTPTVRWTPSETNP